MVKIDRMMKSGPAAPQKAGMRPERRPPRPVTPAFLERAALAYLECYASSAENLRRVLARKVARRCRLRGEDSATFDDPIDAIVARMLASGLVDDRRYAEGRVATLRRRGGSSRLIAARLAAKGVERATIAQALGGDDPEAVEREAALALARRRRLGPYRPEGRADFRDKDLAALARAGFRYDVARRIIDGSDD
jgi:regulatory protein